MRLLFLVCASAIALTSQSNGAAAYPDSAIAVAVARSLGYDQAQAKITRYSITNEWRPLSGETMVCVRREIPNGAGGFAPTNDYNMYSLERGVIVNMIKDNSLFGCPNRSYEPLRPL